MMFRMPDFVNDLVFKLPSITYYTFYFYECMPISYLIWEIEVIIIGERKKLRKKEGKKERKKDRKKERKKED